MKIKRKTSSNNCRPCLPRAAALTVVAALVVFAGYAPVARASEAALLLLSAGHFKDTATVTDDANAGTSTISSERGYVEHTGLLRMVWNDEFLKGVIDRKTGLKSFQVSTLVIYSGDMRSYDAAQYQAGGERRKVATVAQRMQKESCSEGGVNCTYTEHVSFPVDEETLRTAAVREGDKPAAWRYKLIARKGAAYEGALSTAEIAGFLAKVDEATNTVPVARPQAVQARSRDLGVQGISIGANAEQPNRAGVLIAAVKSGSVGQKAGLISGDIVYGFDGHPVKTLADLESAVAGSAIDVAIPVKLYRGLSSITVNAQLP